MAESFWYRTSKVSDSDIYYSDENTPEDKIRNNAWVELKGTGETLPLKTDNLDNTYDPNGTGRPAAVLQAVEIELKGDAGSLRSLKASYICYDKDTFEKLYESFMLIKNRIEVNYGYVGPSRDSQTGGPYYFEVMKPSYKFTAQNTFECSFEALGAGTDYEMGININGQQDFPRKEFVTNYKGTNEKAKSANIFDYMDWVIQNATGKTNSTGFNPKNGASKGGLEGGGSKSGFGVLKAPDEYNPPTKMETAWWSADRIQYVTLALIVQLINKYVLKSNKKKYKLKWHDDYSKIKVKWKKGKIYSPSPMEMLFPYSKGTAENSYHKKKTGKSSKYISCDSFDACGSFSIASGDPKGILISRDLLRGIQNSFATGKQREKDMETELEKDEQGKIRLGPFFKKLFASIKNNSGGAWDFALEHKDLDGKKGGEEKTDIWIVNRRSPKGPSSVTPVMIKPTSGKNGVREFGFSGEIPKDLVSVVFAGQGTDESEDIKVHNDAAEDVDNEAESPALSDRLKKVRGRLNTDDYATDAQTAAAGVIRELVASEDYKANANEFQKLRSWPLKLTLVLDGIEGFRFGDTIGSDYLPDAYDPNKGGAKVRFTVLSYTHKIENNDWTTTLDCISRVVP
jgi:hypothetical protein